MREIIRHAAIHETANLVLPESLLPRTNYNVHTSQYPGTWAVILALDSNRVLLVGLVKHLPTAFRLADAATFRFLNQIQIPVWCYSEAQAADDASLPVIQTHLDKIAGLFSNTIKRQTKNAAYSRKSRYGISEEDFSALLTDQSGKCAVCDSEFSTNLVPKFDAENRGILCRSCHMGIKAFNDSVDQLTSAITYLNAKKKS